MLTTDTCFDCPSFTAWWDAAHRFQLDHHLGWCLGTPDDGWALDALLASYQQGLTPEQAVLEAIDGFDPTP